MGFGLSAKQRYRVLPGRKPQGRVRLTLRFTQMQKQELI